MTSSNITANLKKKAAGSFEAFINLNPNTMRHIQEDSNIRSSNTNGNKSHIFRKTEMD